MNNFWTLVSFEYKKIFIRKSIPILIILILTFNAFLTTTTVIGTGNVSIEGDTYLTNYEFMELNKEYALELSGRELDSELIMEAVDAYRKVPTDVYPYTKSEEYLEFALPYSSILGYIDSAFASRNTGWDINSMQNLTLEEAENYYEKRIEQYQLNLQNNPRFSEDNIKRIIENDSKVTKPFIFQYDSGYTRFLGLSTTTALFIMIFISFAFSSMFSGEYQLNTDSLILTSKNGKKTQIFAKIFTANTLGFIVSIVTFLVSYLCCMLIFGYEGANSIIQNHIALITYDFTMIETVILLFITTIFGTFLMTAITLCFSSILKPILTLSLTMILSFIGLFDGISLPIIENVRYFLPTAMGAFYDIITQLSFNVFGIELWLYQAVCIVAFAIGSLLLLLTYQNFKRHQIS